MNAKDGLQPVQGPQLSVEHVQEASQDPNYQEQARKALASYWDFVLKNPYDFNGWTYLLQQAEHLDDVTEVRKAYKDFLEKYPYCYAYWQRYSEFEQRHNNWERALTLLRLAVTNIPLSCELWLAYLELYHKLYSSSEDFDSAFRAQCEWAIESVGLDYRSDPVWERYIDWELERKNLVWVSGIYRRLVAIPTRLYNKHWDSFIAHVRDHHPRDILEYDEYEKLRQLTCGELGLTYRPDPVVGESKPRQVVQPEDKLKAGMKERIVACVVSDHEKCEEDVDKRFRFEEKIKRPYYHARPLDLKQLKNWEAYLEFEIGNGDHERIVVLFERCLVACANYEQFWVKYARYLEMHHSAEARHAESGDKPAATGKVSTSALKKARWHFGTGLTTVDEMREKRCTWTLRGWKETDKDGNEIMVAEEAPGAKAQGRSSESEVPAESNGSEEARSKSEDAITAPPDPSEGTKWHDVVRNVYSRACVTHCPKKANVKMRWAAFEEEVGNPEKSKAILTDLLGTFPLLLECRLQLIDLERRSGNLDGAEKLYEDLVKLIPKNRLNIRTWVSMKLARFQFKVRGQPEKAVKTLKLAWKKDPSEPKLYAQFIEICYQRQPVNVDGIIMAIDHLALKSDSLTSRQKLEFVKRKVEFMQEYGTIGQLREAGDQLKAFRLLCAGDLKVEARTRKEREREREELGQLDAAKAHVRAEAALKAKLAEAEGRLLCTQCRTAMFPDEDGVYEFERLRAASRGIEAAAVQVDEDGVVDLLDLVIPEDQEEQIKKTLEEKTKYKEVAPTWVSFGRICLILCAQPNAINMKLISSHAGTKHGDLRLQQKAKGLRPRL
jgi:tetratricopeptide (TPR) repeat protein